ncbi:hypothetical protein [Kineosporia babensis]|uniref:Uncharacterized protein n=1 Tax=Kineosporia babensis TaxID=499548 RepID=A0A9X1NFR4_9ACTN|nr:hypothetical protein [Kineosporia babensis]MCD5312991.1 hypothetical protein [Kineosporia babensis]
MSLVSEQVVKRLYARETTRTEADIQADIYTLLTVGGLSLSPDHVARLEVPTKDGTRRRLDVQIGNAVIEVKKNLSKSGTLPDAEEQLAGYIRSQADALQSRYVGILTDGYEWRLYRANETNLELTSEFQLTGSEHDQERLGYWLEAIMATDRDVKPSPNEIRRRLGFESPSHQLDMATLAALFETAQSNKEVALKRGLWGKLLRTAFGKAFEDNEDLFISHTLLVLTAEVIAHAVIGFNVSTGEISPKRLVSGSAFNDVYIHGVVESDFLTGFSMRRAETSTSSLSHGELVDSTGRMSSMMF